MEDDEFPCTNCPFQDTCDGWTARECSFLNDYYGIDDFDPMDI